MTVPTEITETGLMRRIRSLIERAEHAGTPEHERQACLKKADALMFANAIDRATISAVKDKASGIKKFDWEVPWESEFSAYISDIMRKVANHCRLKCASQYGKLVVVGYEEDIMYGQMLWTTIHLEFARRINPSWDNNRTFDENVTLLKEAGKKWPEIGQISAANGHPGSTTNAAWLRNAYRRQCLLEGREPVNHTQRHRAYRMSFAESFFATITRRLRELKATEENSITDRDRVLPALRADSDKVDEVFWEHFPNLHPDAQAAMYEKYRRQAEEDRKRQEALWESMTDEERAAERRRQAREDRKWDRYNRNSYIQVDDAGWSAGDEVARSVNLSMGKNGGVDNRKTGELE